MTGPPASEIRRTGLIALLVMAAAAVAYWGLGIATGNRLLFSHDIGFSDIWHLHYPVKQFYASEIRQGRLPLWCPQIGTGFPLLAEGQVGALYPPNLLLYALFPVSLAFHWGILLHTILSGTFAAMYAREIGASRTGGVLSGIVFAFSGFLVCHARHINMTAAACWLPFVLLLVERCCKERRSGSALLLALAVGATILAGHPQIAYYNLLLTVLYLPIPILSLARKRREEGGGRRPALRSAAHLVGAIALGLLLGAVQILPTAELHRLGPRSRGLTFAQATEWDYHPAYLVTFLAPKYFGDPGRLLPVERVDHPASHAVEELAGFRAVPGGRNFFWEITGYVGLLPLLLAAAGGILGWRRRRVVPLLVLLVASLLLTLGSHGGLARVLFAILPGFDLFRFPCRFLLYVDLFLSVLAGVGLTLVLDRLSGMRREILATIAAGVCFLDLRAALRDQNPTVEADQWLRPPETVQRIRAEEAESTETFRIATYDPARFVFTNAYFLARGFEGDLSPYDRTKETLDPNLNLLYDISSVNFYYQIFPRTMLEAVVATELRGPEGPGGVDPKLASLFNVRYILTPHPLLERTFPVLARFAGDRVQTSAEGARYEIVLHRNPRCLPRAFLVPGARWVRGKDGELQMLRAIRGPTFDPLREVVLRAEEGGRLPSVEESGAPIESPVKFLEYGPQSVRLAVDAPRACWLFLSDTYYPGWRAHVDGKPVPIYIANITGRAVRVPDGRHVVTFQYSPRSFRNGALATLVALLGLGIWALVGFRGRLQRPPVQ